MHLHVEKSLLCSNHTQWSPYLIVKMRTVRIPGTISEWVPNWLWDRKQRVVGGTLSEQGIMGSGVPQGSVLGPLLFLIYINDLDRGIENPLVKLADVTKLGLAPTKVIPEDVNRIQKWMGTWKRKFNTTKKFYT